MNYLWEAVFMADGQGIPRERIRFLAAKDYSAYMEVSHMFLNQDAFDDDCRLEVNPYYRFYDIDVYDSLKQLVINILNENWQKAIEELVTVDKKIKELSVDSIAS